MSMVSALAGLSRIRFWPFDVDAAEENLSQALVQFHDQSQLRGADRARRLPRIRPSVQSARTAYAPTRRTLEPFPPAVITPDGY
jgi:hypothetical protein